MINEKKALEYKEELEQKEREMLIEKAANYIKEHNGKLVMRGLFSVIWSDGEEVSDMELEELIDYLNGLVFKE